jgi:WW domain-containing oxidoreductase
VGIPILSILLIRETWQELIRGPIPIKQDLKKKVFVVTGANSGCGKETARMLAEWGGIVIMCCRSMSRGEAARQDILKTTKATESDVKLFELDLASRDSIHKFVAIWNAAGIDRIDGLVLNAGVMLSVREETSEGVEMTMMCNHFGHFLLTHLLRPALEKTAEEHDEARIVVVSSGLHKSMSCKGLLTDPDTELEEYGMFKAYGKSKLANMLFAHELSRQLVIAKSKVTCNSLHPGNVKTEVTRNLGPVMAFLNQLFAPFLDLFRKQPHHGAYTPVHVATSPELKGKSGDYFVHCAPAEKSKDADDSEAAEKLWHMSEEVVGILATSNGREAASAEQECNTEDKKEK